MREWETAEYLDEHERQYKAIRSEFPEFVTTGFSCWTGWYGILREFFAAVRDAVPAGQEHRWELAQVKEKMGGLHIYWRFGTNMKGPLAKVMAPDVAEVHVAIARAVYLAEQRSVHTCEVCGAPGRSVSNEGWHGTRCRAHVDGALPDGHWRINPYRIGGELWEYDAVLDELVKVPERSVAEMLEAKAEEVGESLETAVIGPKGDVEDADDWPGWSDPIPRVRRGVMLPWGEARQFLDYTPPSDERRGRRIGMHPVYAWTRSWVLIMHRTIIGEIEIAVLPRVPMDITPRFV